MKILKNTSLILLLILSSSLMAQITITPMVESCQCNGYNDGSIDVSVTGGTPPYTYNWENDSGQGVTISTEQDLYSIYAGSYSVTVTDYANEIEILNNIIVTEPDPVILLVDTIINPICGLCDGIVVVSFDGGIVPYSFDWDGIAQPDVITGLCAGIYEAQAIDAHGCSSILYPIELTDSLPIIVNVDSIKNSTDGVCNGIISTNITGGTANYYLDWSNGETTQMIENLCEGTYTVSVSDANGCFALDSFDIDNIYDSAYAFVDTLSITIDTCLFDNSLPIDSASIYDVQQTNSDSIYLAWVFWQAGNSFFLELGTIISNPGMNLVYLDVICNNNVNDFYGVFNLISTNILRKEKSIELSIYPNPVKEYFTVGLDNNEKTDVIIIDITGKIIYQNNFSKEMKISTTDFKSGIYFVKIKNNNDVITREIIVE